MAHNPGAALSAADFELSMASLLPRNDLTRTRAFSDLEIERVQDLLVRAGKRSWSSRPQTYAALRLIGCLDLMQAFVVEGLTDDEFPYRMETLPPDMRSDVDACELFLNKQWLVVGKVRDKVPAPRVKEEIQPLELSAPAELDAYESDFLGPTINISHDNSKIEFKPVHEHVEDLITPKMPSAHDALDPEMLDVHKRPAASSRGSSALSQTAHKKQETEQLARPSSAASEPILGTSGRPRPSQGNSVFSQEIHGRRSPKSGERRPSPARTPTAPILEVQRPRTGSRGISTMSDPLQAQQALQTNRSTSPAGPAGTSPVPISGVKTARQTSAGHASTPPIPTSSPSTAKQTPAGQPSTPPIPTTSLNIQRQTSKGLSRSSTHSSADLSPPPLRPRSDTRPISPGSTTYSPDQIPSIPEGGGDKVLRHNTADSSGLGFSLRSRPSFASRTSSRNSTDRTTSVFSAPSSFLSTSSSESNTSRFGKLFTKTRPLIEAAKSGDADRVKEVLRLHGDSAMNGHDGKDNWTALHWAASIGATDACRVLLSRGMSTSARTKNQSREPLFLAVKGGHLETARVLCQANCDVNAGSKIDGATALHRAALQGNDEIITLLIEYGADVNQVDIEGMRPTMWAVQAKRNATVAHLVASGADLEAKSAAGLTLLHRAVSSRNVDMVRLLLSLGSDVNAPAPFGNALNRADATGNGEMISLLSEYGAVREVRTDARGAPLQFTGSYAHGHLD